LWKKLFKGNLAFPWSGRTCVTYFPFCIHNHQPVGNFGFVLEEAYKKSYWPFLRLLFEFPSMKMTLHNSGFLLDWIVKNHPEYMELLEEMVNRGQVEVMGGGFYEPVLAVIPERDRLAQIEKMRARLEDLLGVSPRGLWLAERVWEPTLPSTLGKAGVEYVLVDDFHFIKAGLAPEDLGGYYITEDCGSTVKVFPGSEALRYLIPFRPVEDVEAHFRGIGDALRRGDAAIYGDDGEKFGVWPGTNKHVYKEGWLKRFFEMITSLEGVVPVTLGEYADLKGPLGRVYLPTCSYMEMGEWSLPPEAAREYHGLIESLDKEGKAGGTVKKFIQGGTWRGFFAKYPESNWMHKRMLMASRLLWKRRAEGGLSEEDLGRAENALYMAQCNDAFWHGIFGGLYLPHLRAEIYRKIIEAEKALASEGHGGPVVDTFDLDADGRDEVIIRSGPSTLFLSPHYGGAAFELDSSVLGVNAMNVLTRWPEAYHHRVGDAGDGTGEKGAKSIHDTLKSKEKDIGRFLVVDPERRGSLVERLIAPDDTLTGFSRGEPRWPLTTTPVETLLTEKGAIFTRNLPLPSGHALPVTKAVLPLGDGVFRAAFILGDNCKRAYLLEGWHFGLEFNILLPGCDGPRSSLEIVREDGPTGKTGLKKAVTMEGIRSLTLSDGHAGLEFRLETDREARLLSYPVYTVTLSEAGLERCFQGTCLLVSFPIILEQGSEGREFNLRFELRG